MQRFYSILLTFCLPLLFINLYGQACNYQLGLSGFGPASWTNSELDIVIGGDTMTYTLENTAAQNFNVVVNDGDSLVVIFNEGFFPNEISFILSDNNGEELLFVGNGTGLNGEILLATTASCPPCSSPNIGGDPMLTRLRATSVDLAYRALGPDTAGNAAVYLIEYGAPGFTPGGSDTETATTTDTVFRVQPLVENTAYDIYLSTLCFEGQDTSVRLGPFSITTPFKKNVGASAIYSPESGCDLSFEELEIGLTNFGGEPQTFIPFNYSVNGIPGQVNMPQDGLYTGVLGVDSTETTSFDNMLDLSVPGEYVIAVWTEFAGDSLRSNDTITQTILSAPTIVDFPYYEDYETSNGLWSDQVYNPSVSSWEYGQPTGNIIENAAGGNNAWVTNLDGSYLTGESSFLYSPCFDLSDIEDPMVLNFAFYNAADFGEDFLQLEVSIDGGDYNRVGNGGEGINWYNDFFEGWWDNDFGGVQSTWLPSAILIDSLAGEDRVRFRFRFQSDPFNENTLDGFGIDNFYFTPQPELELAANTVNGPQGQVCATSSDLPTISFFSLGSAEANDIQLSYQANGGEIVTETYPFSLGAFQQATYTFTTPYDGTQADEIELVAWVSIAGDDFQQNDTVRTIIETRRKIPFYEDFETGTIAVQEWQISPGVVVEQAHNSSSTVLYANLYSGQQSMQATTPVYGPVEEGDSLSFDYRFSDFFAGTNGTALEPGDSLSVDLILDCGDEVIPAFISITSENHQTSASEANIIRAFPPATYGRGVQVRFNGTFDPNGVSDFYIDIDNLNLKRCSSLALEGTVVDINEEIPFGSVATVASGGIEPYSYQWSNDATTPTINGLEEGSYTVTVTDRQGCTSEATYEVMFVSDVVELTNDLSGLNVFPNPTNGLVQLRLELTNERDLQVQLLNQFGQQLAYRDFGRIASLNESFDLADQPAGIYFLQVFSEGQQQTIKVVKTK